MTLKQELQQRALFTAGFQNYEKGLNLHAFYKLHDKALGENLVQETFMKTWVYLAKGGRIETMKAFLYHVLNNLIVDEYRKHKTVSLDALLEKGFEPVSSSEPETVVNILDGKAAMNLIDKLPEKYKKVMQMRYLNDLSLEEIARVTGKSKNTMAVQAHRGLKMLKTLHSNQ